MNKKEIIKKEIEGIFNVPVAYNNQGIGYSYFDNNSKEIILDNYKISHISQERIVNLDRLAEFLAKYIDLKKSKCPNCGK